MKKSQKSESMNDQITSLVTVDNIPGVLEMLNARIANLKRIEETPYRTTGNLEVFGNLTQETKIENLIKAFSMVRGKEQAYHDAAKELGLTSYPNFSISGGNTEDWKHDIMLRIDIIQYKQTLDELNEFHSQFSKFVSEEDQKKMLMNKFMEKFGK